MIEQIDRELAVWVSEIDSQAAISFAPPGREQQQPKGINLYLLALCDKPPLRGSRRSPLQLGLRYLVTTWGDTVAAAHRLMGELVFMAMAHERYEVEFEPLTPALWQALGVVPQPAFILCVPLRLDRPEPDVPLVLEPPVVQGTLLTEIKGVLLGPNGVPLVGARVEYLELERVVRTDGKGGFRLTAVPLSPRSKQLRIKAKGKVVDVVIELPATADEIIIIQIDLLQEK